MLEFLRDPLWQFVGVALAVVAIVVSLRVYVAQRPRKRLLVERIARVPLVAGGSKGIPGLRILFGERELKSALVVLVRVQCTGNGPIVANDYETPLRLQFEDEATVLSADAVDTTPLGIPVSLACDGSGAIASKQLLNPGDFFTVRLLVENSKGRLEATARIAGVVKLEVGRRISLTQPASAILGLVLIVVAFVFTPEPKSTHLSDIRPDEVPYAIAITVGFLLMPGSALSQARSMLRVLRDRLRPYRLDDE